MTEPEFSRSVRVDAIGPGRRELSIEAKPAERAALAARFNIASIEHLSADAALTRTGDHVTAAGTLHASVTQSCVVTDVPVAGAIEEPFRIVFRPQIETAPDEELELSEEELDVVFYAGVAIDLGEAVAETLALALPLYPRAPEAEEALKAAGVKNEEEAGPFGALAALKDKLGK